jgi:hypothetical protein
MEEQRAHLALRSLYQRLYAASSRGVSKYGNDETAVVDRPTTTANRMNDLIFAELINEFDGARGIEPVFDKRKNLRFLKVDGRPPIHLWLKLTDPGHRSSNFPTTHSDDFLKTGQLLLYPNAVTLMLGYLPLADRSGVRRVSITPPCGRGSRPLWWIDITAPPNVVGMPSVARSSSVRIVVTRSSQQRDLEA